jgi:pimeloyl-ACP methyl ester carboxylesterase
MMHMAKFESGDLELHYDEYGTGFPVLLIAPGGMKSEASFWESTPWNPIEQLRDKFRVIAMDQRNAGRSTGPISESDSWNTYTQDQLDLLDHLEIDQFHAVGMCIGGPYVMGLIEAAPDRVASGVLFQTIGLSGNREAFFGMYDAWASELRPLRPEVSADTWQQFRSNMYGGDEILFNVGESFLKTVATPLLLLKGNDLYHPAESSLAVNDLCRNSTLISDWQTGNGLQVAAREFETFLERHTP